MPLDDTYYSLCYLFHLGWISASSILTSASPAFFTPSSSPSLPLSHQLLSSPSYTPISEVDCSFSRLAFLLLSPYFWNFNLSYLLLRLIFFFLRRCQSRFPPTLTLFLTHTHWHTHVHTGHIKLIWPHLVYTTEWEIIVEMKKVNTCHNFCKRIEEETK